MIITTLGTIEQKNIGLFAAQEKYFSSMYFTFYGIPLPGGGTVLTILTIGLFSQLAFNTKYHVKRKLGVVLTHIGAAILLIGSYITYFFAVEGSMIIREGQVEDSIQDYKKHEIVIIDSNHTPLFSSPLVNCLIHENSAPKDQEIGFARLFRFSQDQTEKSQEICSEIEFQHKNNRSIYRIFLNMPKQQSIEIDDKLYTLKLQSKRVQLPFKIKLIDFEKKFHQGTMISKSFKSFVEIYDGELVFNRVIEMNAPLRYKGYTFYQSSFSENSEGEMSELAVVKNLAQWFPYLSSIILCLGILVHLIIKATETGKNE
jgi:cytochrome c biogenesis protein ResB